jgi:type IV fimbrial biogenesis protein FimT
MRRHTSDSPPVSLGRSRGFTLMELMFTLLLAGILLGIGVPSFRGMIANNRLSSQTNEIIAAINMARSEAITRNTRITLCRAENETATECATDDDPWESWLILNAAGDVLRTGVFNTYSGSIFVTAEFADQTVIFQPDGLSRTSAGLIVDEAITICSTQVPTDNVRTITLGAGSRISSAKTTGSCS